MGKVYWQGSEVFGRWAYWMWQGILGFRGGRGSENRLQKTGGLLGCYYCWIDWVPCARAKLRQLYLDTTPTKLSCLYVL